MRGSAVLLALTLTLTLTLSSPALAQPVAVTTSDLPERPERLVFDELDFAVPDGDGLRHVLSSGVAVYVAEDHTFPLVNLQITLRQGSYLEPADEVGLASLTGRMIRTGGTESMTPETFDEEAEFLAASISSSGGDAQASASLGCITPELDACLGLFFEMLRRPRFDESRLQIEKGNILESMRQRNDDADDILGREWGFLLYGKDHYSSRRMTEASLDAISRADLVAFHEKYWRPENMVIAVSGDVDTNAFLSKLENYLADWPGEGAEANWPPPQPTHTVEPGVYSVEKDIPQGKVLIGHLVPQWTDWDNPDRAALQVMQHILGGSGFTSRIMKRVRSDEGLAYSAGSQFSFNALEPGTFTISFQSKSPTVALAARIALEEVTRIQSEPVTAEELGVAKSSLIDTFPRRFESARQRAGIFATDAYLGRSHAYWQNWRPQIEAVTADDVMRVAKEYLSPENIVFLVVGKWEEIAPGDPDDRANMMEFFGGEVTNIPLRDPLTLE